MQTVVRPALGLLLGMLIWATPVLAAPASRADCPTTLPVLLVHGMAWIVDKEDATWGRIQPDRRGRLRPTGLAGELDRLGLRYGGTIRPHRGKIAMVSDLDTRGVAGAASDGRLFVLQFSTSANTDGLALKALELAEAVRQICRYTDCPKVRIVAHSAGGLVARVYLQGALPGVPYRGDVDRLITIGTPHLGSSLAEHFGDYLGTRATSLKPTSSLIREINAELELPDDVRFVSIVVRGIGADTGGVGDFVTDLVDGDLYARLPDDLRLGGDEVVPVSSQNLRLARCAARYERRTGRPVHYLGVRVPDPAPGSCWPMQSRVHMASLADPGLRNVVAVLVRDDCAIWSPSDRRQGRWFDWQAGLQARHILEAEAEDEHPLSEVKQLDLEDLRLVAQHGATRVYAFSGRAWSDNWLIPFRKRWTHTEGTLRVTYDTLGRMSDSSFQIEQCEDR